MANVMLRRCQLQDMLGSFGKGFSGAGPACVAASHLNLSLAPKLPSSRDLARIQPRHTHAYVLHVPSALPHTSRHTLASNLADRRHACPRGAPALLSPHLLSLQWSGFGEPLRSEKRHRLRGVATDRSYSAQAGGDKDAGSGSGGSSGGSSASSSEAKSAAPLPPPWSPAGLVSKAPAHWLPYLHMARVEKPIGRYVWQASLGHVCWCWCWCCSPCLFFDAALARVRACMCFVHGSVVPCTTPDVHCPIRLRSTCSTAPMLSSNYRLWSAPGRCLHVQLAAVPSLHVGHCLGNACRCHTRPWDACADGVRGLCNARSWLHHQRYVGCGS